ncbi:MAG: helix-turn-helix domain-containing protein [Proteobacteria bacterium]|nr:helix-turn-helix domain-containing protein [Pseudomonadota bacterium]
MRDSENPTNEQETNALPLILTVKETAALLRVNRNTVYELFQRGELPGGRRVGRCIRFSREAVLQWLRGNVSTSREMRKKS